MNEAEKKKAELVEEAKQETGAAGDSRKYSLRGARLAIQRKEAAIQKRSEKITQLQLENQQDREYIRQLKKVCAELQAQEVNDYFALRKAPFRLKESSSARQGKH